MKFGKSLSTQIEKTLPEWRDKFLSYKELKKKLKQFEPPAAADDRPGKRLKSDAAPTAADMSKEETDFHDLLENELDKFNTFFVEKEEEYIIRLKVLSSVIPLFLSPLLFRCCVEDLFPFCSFWFVFSIQC